MTLALAHWRRAMLAFLMGCALAAAQTRPATDRADQDDDPPQSEPVRAVSLQIVDLDRPVEDRLREVAQWLADKRYDESIDALHVLMTSQEKMGLQSASGDGRRYCGSVEAAARIIGSLPDEALDLYGRRHGLAAQGLLEAARAKRDEASLVAAGERYFHTPAGGQALAEAAAVAYDRGEYLKAAGLWERLYREHRRLKVDRPMLLTKAAIAYHLADLPSKAEALRQRLKELHATAEARIAGQPTSLAAFLDKALATPPPSALTPPRALPNWPALAGSASGVATVADLDPAPVPLCTIVDPRRAGAAPATTRASDSALRIALADGRLLAGKPVPGLPDTRFDLPPLVHPVADAGVLLVRQDDAIAAFSLQTRKELWRTPSLPVYHEAAEADAAGAQRALAGDMGHYALTLGDGRAYALARLSPVGRRAYRLSDADRAADVDGSMLAAISVKPEGPSLAWEIGRGKGDCDFLRQAKYLSVPTFDDGRLYLLARLGNRYHAVCLNAARGTLHWQSPLGVVPFRGGATMSGPQVYALEVATERGSPPAVAGGMVVLTTNAGIVAALDATSGASLWAHRYDSRVSGPASGPTTIDLQGQAIRMATLRQPYPPINPVILAQGRAICLPCDSDAAISLDARTGELLWRQPRQDQQDLTALDDRTVLLSGPDWLVLRAGSGSLLHREPAGVLGRPAVTSAGVLACDRGALARLDTARKVVALKRVAGEALLGNALVADGQLVTANSAGLSVFSNHEVARAMLRARADAAAQPLERARTAYLAGTLAASADHLDDAATQLALCVDEASKAGDPTFAGRARSCLFEVHMRQVARGGDPRAIERYLDLAASRAITPAQRRQALAARIGHQEKLNKPAEAIALAQSVLEARAADWQAGRSFALVEYLTASAELQRLLRAHGAQGYWAHDSKMADSRARARAQGNVDELVAASRRWPAATQSADALLDAAQILLRRATATARVDVAMAAGASRLAAEAANSARDDVRARAAAALSIVDLRCRPNLAAARAGQLAVHPATQPVRFGDFDGTIRDLIGRCDAMRSRPLAPDDADFRILAAPLSFVFRAPAGLVALRDTRGQVLRAGERLWLVGPRRLLCLDTQRNSFDHAQVWSLDLPSFGPDDRCVGQLSEDGRRLAILRRSGLLMLDAATGKPLHQASLDWLGPRGWVRAAGHGDWLALLDDGGRVLGLKLSDGKVAWTHRSSRFDAGGLTARGDLLLLTDAGRGRHVCLDMRTGRVLTEATARGRDSIGGATLTPEGLLLSWDNGGGLAVDDPRAGTSYSTDAWRGAEWQVLGAGRRYVGLCAGARVAVLDLADIQRPLDLRLEGSRPPRPLAIDFTGDRALLLTADDAGGDGLTNPTVAAFELPSAKLLWRAPVGSPSATACRAVEMEIQGNVAAIASTPLDDSRAARHLVLRLEDGQAYDCAQAMDDGVLFASQLPIVLNGRMLVLTSEGLACLASLRP
jgi:outer membrane protein assembly factor BamB